MSSARSTPGRALWWGRPRRESLSKKLGLRITRAIRARDEHRCRYCGATAEGSGAPLHLDHLTPRSLGGLDVASNLVLACRRCNSAPARTERSRSGRATPRGALGLEIDPRMVRAHARRRLPATVRIQAVYR